MRKIAVLTLAALVPLQAAHAVRHDLAHAYGCHTHVRPPVGGYLLRDTARPSTGLFHRGSDQLTSGLLAGWGGTWVLVLPCVR